ncbi:MAG: TrkH family potassium uptake protein [Geminicoccaceae bacterium]|nr:TrkH family potassium uptake protein [Geminicoccaceae bacterium]
MRRSRSRLDLRAIVDLRPVAMVVGIVLLVLALAMLPSMLADLIAGHADWQVFLLSASCTAFIGVSLILMTTGVSRTPELTVRQGFLLTTLTWVTTTAFAALPFAFSDLGLGAAGAFFEAMSGITTTGSTVIVGLEAAPPGILLWRAMLQWLGGIGIIVMGIAILPMLSIGGMQLFRTESTDSSEKILPRAAQIATNIALIYLLLSLLCASIYWLFGMSWFDAAAHAMTTIATGGYSTYDASIGHFASPAIEWTAITFMIVGGIPFVLYVQILRGQKLQLFHDVQVRWFLGILAGGTALLAFWLVQRGLMFGHDGLRHAAFATVSVVTGTGYAASDFNAWGTFPVGVIFFLMCIGGCSGSTTGGMKVFRFAVLYQIARVQVLRLLQPSGVFRPIYNGQPVADQTAISILGFVFVFALSFAVLSILLSFLGLDYLTAMSGALSALANVGPGLGDLIGPAKNFAALPDTAKWLLSAGMLLGRLELFTVLVLFAPAFWRA